MIPSRPAEPPTADPATGGEGAPRKIIHVDMDAFYASVEQRDDPSLAGRPVIVGGRPNGRGVVAACSYEARAYGVHSAMPSAEAGRRCPQAVFVRPRFEVYREVSAEIHAVLRRFTDLIEPLSLDEAYLDVTASCAGGDASRLEGVAVAAGGGGDADRESGRRGTGGRDGRRDGRGSAGGTGGGVNVRDKSPGAYAGGGDRGDGGRGAEGRPRRPDRPNDRGGRRGGGGTRARARGGGGGGGPEDVPRHPRSAIATAREIKRLILERTGLVASAGVSYNKFLAKIASDLDKPDGLSWILPEDGEAFVATLPIGAIHGVGRVTEARMHALGIRTGGDLRAWSREALAREFGKSHEFYYRAARGVDHRPVRASRVRKSMGSERTFAENLTDRGAMLEVLERLAGELLVDLAARGLGARTLTVKARFPDFETPTRSHSQPRPFDAASAGRALPYLLDRALEGRAAPSVRLLGVSFGSLAGDEELPPEQLEIDWTADGPASAKGA